jgi:hypothetical protein
MNLNPHAYQKTRLEALSLKLGSFVMQLLSLGLILFAATLIGQESKEETDPLAGLPEDVRVNVVTSGSTEPTIEIDWGDPAAAAAVFCAAISGDADLKETWQLNVARHLTRVGRFGEAKTLLEGMKGYRRSIGLAEWVLAVGKRPIGSELPKAELEAILDGVVETCGQFPRLHQELVRVSTIMAGVSLGWSAEKVEAIRKPISDKEYHFYSQVLERLASPEKIGAKELAGLLETVRNAPLSAPMPGLIDAAQGLLAQGLKEMASEDKDKKAEGRKLVDGAREIAIKSNASVAAFELDVALGFQRLGLEAEARKSLEVCVKEGLFSDYWLENQPESRFKIAQIWKLRHKEEQVGPFIGQSKERVAKLLESERCATLAWLAAASRLVGDFEGATKLAVEGAKRALELPSKRNRFKGAVGLCLAYAETETKMEPEVVEVLELIWTGQAVPDVEKSAGVGTR